VTSKQQLTWRGFQRVNYRLALDMLGEYGIQPERIRLISSSTNFIYRFTHNKKRLILRLAYPGWRTYDDARSEAAWLEALARDTDIPVPELIPTSGGDLVAQKGDRHAVLMPWLPGMLLSRRLTEANLWKMG
jgi:Ser/Thr protein kinase RdoA (MazF antagonist)